MSAPTTVSPAQAYETYYGPAIFEPLAARTIARAAPRSGDAVLDVACGTGIVTRRAAPCVDGGRVVGLDRNPAMLEVARELADRSGDTIEYVQGDATEMDLEDAAFDLVLCQQGLQFLDDRAAGARGLRRVLRDDGRAVVAVWQGPERHPLFAALADAEVPHLERFGVPVTYEDTIAPFSLGDPDELEALLVGAGFGPVDLAEERIVARFPDADRYVQRMEHAYAAVIPAFLDDPVAFRRFCDAIDREVKPIVDTFRVGDEIVVPMHANLAVARA
jgi:SAM-dependent methyltransferase